MCLTVNIRRMLKLGTSTASLYLWYKSRKMHEWHYSFVPGRTITPASLQSNPSVDSCIPLSHRGLVVSHAICYRIIPKGVLLGKSICKSALIIWAVSSDILKLLKELATTTIILTLYNGNTKQRIPQGSPVLASALWECCGAPPFNGSYE